LESAAKRGQWFGKIDLTKASTLHETYHPMTRQLQYNDWAFEVHTLDRIYYLIADSEDEMHRWMEAIGRVLDKLRLQEQQQQQPASEGTIHKSSSFDGFPSPSIASPTPRPATPNPPATVAAPAEESLAIPRPSTPLEVSKQDGGATPGFENFGKHGGEPIVNKDTILDDIDRALGHSGPPAVSLCSTSESLLRGR
jgi:hypothetical protein